jgi:hypothetical protein
MCLADLIDVNPARPSCPRLGPVTNWEGEHPRAAPRAIRWVAQLHQRWQAWSAWHWTEGNGTFTACGQPIAGVSASASPTEGALDQITCAACLARMVSFGVVRAVP